MTLLDGVVVYDAADEAGDTDKVAGTDGAVR
jgi:hypothetical protein